MPSENNARPTPGNAVLTRRSFKRFLKIFSGGVLYLSLAAIAYLFCLPATTNPSFKGRNERTLAQMYDKDDLSSSCLFAGNFINFGFWDPPTQKGKISVAQRIDSERNLYRYISKKLELTPRDKVLEVGCGQGVGSAMVLIEFNPQEIHGIDFSHAQICRAEKANAECIQKNSGRIFFQKGSADNIPYESNSFDKIFSINAAQHFESLEKFAKEANRVLKAGGKLVIASFFGTSDKSEEALSEKIL